MTQFTIGQDVQVKVNGPYGPLTLPLNTGFSCEPIQKIVSVKTLSGRVEHRLVMDGFHGKIDAAREDSTVDDLIQRMQDDYLNGVPIPQGSIYYVVKEQNGQTTAFTLTKVVFVVSQAGDYKADSDTMQTIEYHAQERQKG